MTEYEKMIAGNMYNATDPELSHMREACRHLLDQINSSARDIRSGERLDLCRTLFASVGNDLWLQPPFFCDYGANIFLGANVFINFNCVFLDVARITVGDFVFLGPGVQLYTAAHPLEWKKRRDSEEYGRPITIEDDVWIGGGVIICPGVTVRERSVIGAGSVVTKDVPSSSVVVGNPARIIATRNDADF
jgi:maltose O-acetyltransferase